MGDVQPFQAWAADAGWRVRANCVICRLPVALRAEVERAWVDLGARESALLRYLAAQGHPLTSTGPIGNHFRTGRHHERAV